ncbi:MAG TPA: von Willebrand factor type A domain-containing protein [Thermoanaerobaculia bacterium]|nr:von Willebrand factor type A domain-containing protein [Thermoanaerobaculia bacterium]
MIHGRVFADRSPLPGATVTLSAKGLGTRAVATNVNGEYRFVNVSPGSYTLVVELEGMQRQTRQLEVKSEVVELETRLRLSYAAEAITVTAAAPSNEPGVFHAPQFGSSTVQSYRVPATMVSASPAYPAMYLEPAKTAQYAAITESLFQRAADQPVTTFSIDVDRASYANVRRFLSANQLPPADAVRIEEMINYFPYAYAEPNDGRPFSISTEVAGCPWNLNHRLMRIGIRGRRLDQWQMAPNNLVFLLDVSGSMEPSPRLPLLKSALRVLVEQLRTEDSVAIVVFTDSAMFALPRTSGADKATILAAVNSLEAGGSTAGGAGIELAYKVAQENFLRNGNNRVILATDGDFNVGMSRLDELTKLIEEKRKLGIFLTCLGVGDDNLNDALLEKLADTGNGNYMYLDTLKEAEKVFVHELTGTLVAVAKDVKVQLELNPAAVESYRQIGYENRALANKDFEDDTKDAGELGAGHTVTALYELVPKNGVAAGTELAKLRLRYKEPNADTSQLAEVRALDDGKSVYEASADLQFAAAVAELGMLLRKSPHRGTATYDDVLALARTARGPDPEGYREELIRMTETSRALSGEQTLAVAGRYPANKPD